MELGVLGPLQVRGAPGGETPARDRERALLAVLALELDRVVSYDTLGEALWPGDLASHAGGLKTYVMRLRKVVGPDAVQTTTRGYLLTSVDVTRDADDFEHAVARVGPGADPLAAEDRVELLTTALNRWRGRPYDELGEWPPAVLERRRLEELRHLALEARSDAELELGTASIAALEHLVADQPLRERRWQQLMIGLYRSGRQAEALRAFERARVLLRDQLGVEPGVDLASLERAILRHEPALGLRPSDDLIPVAARDTRVSGSPVDPTGTDRLAVAQEIDDAIETGQRRLRAGHPTEALDAFAVAAEQARRIGDTGRLLRVAIAGSGEGWNSGLDPLAPHVLLLEEAARLPASYSPMRAQVLARLTVAKSFHEPVEVGRERAREALDLARLTGDRQTLALALEANLVIEQDPAEIERRERWVDALADLTDPADLTDGGPVAPWTTMVWARARIQGARGDVDGAIETLRTIDRHRLATKHPLARMMASMGTVLDCSRRGEWSATRDALADQRDAGASSLLDPAAALLAHEGASNLVDALEGTVREMSRFRLAPFPVSSGEVMLAAGMARACPSPGEGREVLEELRPDAVAAVPRDLLWPSMIWAMAEATHAVGAAAMAGALHEAARPFAWLTCVDPGGTYLGSMEHHLGLLAATAGDARGADRHFDAALDAHRLAGAPEWVRRTEACRAAGAGPSGR